MEASYSVFPLGKNMPKSSGYGEDGLIVYFDTEPGESYVVAIDYTDPTGADCLNAYQVAGDGTKQNVQHQLGTIERDGYRLNKITIKKIEN